MIRSSHRKADADILQTEHKTDAFEGFWRNMKERNLNPQNYSYSGTGQKYLDINPEGALLRESQDIAEELRIMLRVYNQQLNVVKDFSKALRHMNGESKNETDEVRKLMKILQARQEQSTGVSDNGNAQEKGIVPESTIQEANDLLELIRNRKLEIQDLEDAILRTSQQVSAIIDDATGLINFISSRIS